MPSQESTLAEHKKYRNQSQVRIRSGIRLVLFLAVVGALVTWFYPKMWPVAAALVAFFSVTTLIEVWAFRKHDRALKESDS